MSQPTLQNSWYEIRNAASGGEMVLYGVIGPYQNIDDKAFVRDFGALAAKHKQITLRLNSGGGSVFAGLPIYNAITSSTAEVSVVVEGMAASMASIVLMSASKGKRKMYKNTRVMVHKPSGGAFGSASKMRETADLLDSLEETLADIYVEKTGQSAAIVQAWLVEGKDRWFTAKEALALGIIDEIIDADPVPVQAPKNSLSEEDMFAHYQAALAEAPPETLPTTPPTNNESSPQPPNLLMKYGLIQAAAQAAGVTAALSDTSSESDIVDVINRVAKAKDDEIGRLNNLLTAANDEKVTTLIAEAVSSGKIVASQKDDYESLARADFKRTSAIIQNLAPKPSATGLLVAEAGSTTTDAGTDPRAGWDFNKWRREDPQGLAQLQASDPKLVDALRSKHVSQLSKKHS